MDVSPCECVTNAGVAIEVRGQELLLFRFREFANVSAEASVSAPPMPKNVWNVFVGSTKTQICVSSGWPIGLNLRVLVAESRCLVLSAVV